MGNCCVKDEIFLQPMVTDADKPQTKTASSPWTTTNNTRAGSESSDEEEVFGELMDVDGSNELMQSQKRMTFRER